MTSSTRVTKGKEIFACPVIELDNGEFAFELSDDLLDKFSLSNGDTITFKQQVGDRYSMIIRRGKKK